MAVLGIESSAHTLGIGIIDGDRFLSNKRIMFPITNNGIIPSELAEFHSKNAANALKSALDESSLSMRDISAIGYTKGPGLGPALNVGAISAKALALRYKIPIYPINHALAHLEIVRHINNFDDPLFLYVSGGNSQILGFNEKKDKYHIYGETFDIGIGNMLDNFARAAKLIHAWGSSVATLAENGSYIQMPYTVKGMDFTFTGLLTHAVKMLDNPTINKSDIAYSLQETAFSMLCEATERALMLTKKKELGICGGVAQSVRLKAMLKCIADEHKIKFGFVENQFNADNGAMIALVAQKMLSNGVISNINDCNINQRFRIDTARVYK